MRRASVVMGDKSMYYYVYDPARGIPAPEPFKRTITPMFMGDDPDVHGVGFSVHFTEWEPGCEVDLHAHADATEAMYCVSGTGVATTNGEEHPFVPGAMIVAPPGVSHSIHNTGEELLRVFCIFSPPVTAQSLRDRAMTTVAQAKGDNA